MSDDAGAVRVREAACACRRFVVRCEGEPVRVSVCHCLDCQRRTGSAFGVQARFARDRVHGIEAGTSFVRKGDSGGSIHFRFCSGCGSTVAWEPDGLPDFVVVAMGAFADPSFLAPVISIYESRQHAWLKLEGEIDHHE
ncbi:MAG: GFA family protein [Deltaproteobacteria bacterium]|nr:GFA family protein [Deltaproteobacteria bacterium]